MLTKEEQEIQNALTRLWYTHYDRAMTQSERNRLVQEFVDKWLIEPKFNPRKPFIRHPATYHKSGLKRVTVFDVLADFILHAKYKDEKNAEYPVLNPDQTAYQEEKQKGQLSITVEEEDVKKYRHYVVCDEEMINAVKIS